MDTKTLERIKALRSEAAAFANFHTNYREKYAADPGCDKKGYGFNRDDRFSAFKLTISFDSWAGYYGHSSCSRIFNVYYADMVKPFIVTALNAHQQEIFATAARLMREEAASLTGKAAEEISALQRMLDDLRPEAPAATPTA